MPFISVLTISILFFFLGKGAALVVNNLKAIAQRLGLSIGTLGLVLGFVTSLPEIAIATKASIDGVSSLSMGNLLGAVMVLFCLILGLSITLNRGIATDGHAGGIVAATVYFALPILLGLDGTIGAFDGFILLFAFIPLLVLLFRPRQQHVRFEISLVHDRSLFNHLILAVVGMLIVAVASDLIVRQTEHLLANTGISPFIIGLLIFGIGTNLPELTIAITAWRRHSAELSVSNLVGSSVTNIVIIGVLAVARPLVITNTISFLVSGIFLVVAGSLMAWFFWSQKKLSSREGLILLAVYFIFVSTQLFLLV